MSRGKNISVTLTALLQIFTGCMHAISLFVTQHPTNDTERKLLHLMQHHNMDMGYGFHTTMYRLTWGLSACFTLLYLFAGCTNLLITPQLGNPLYRKICLLQVGVFGTAFAIMATHAFLPPIVCTGLVLLGLLVMLIFSFKK